MSYPRRLFRTDSFRHAILYGGLFGLSMAVLIGITYVMLNQSFKANLMREIDDDLTSMRTAYLTAKPGKALHEAAEIVEDRLLAPDADDVFLLQRGRVRVAGNLPSMAPRLGVFAMTVPASRHTILGRGAQLAPGVYAFVGRDLQQLKDTETRLLRAFGVVLLVSLVLASLFALLLSRSFVRRIDTVTQTCRGIMAGQMSRRIPAAEHGDEFNRLGLAINEMLDRIQALMESLRQVSTDIAHDMRTPLTHLRHRLDRIRGEAQTQDEYAAAVDGATAECDKLLAIFTALLRIAQIEAGARRSEFRAVDLAHVIKSAHDIYAPVMEDAVRDFKVEAGAAVAVCGDEQLLLQLVSNLLNNAIAHTPDRTDIAVMSGMENGRPVLIVADRGPGIPVPDRTKVIRRFYRLEQSRTQPGSGLGLALVAAVVELHGAELELLDNNPGLRVVVRFPVSSASV
ncbi:sensor histidine kinase [Rhizomicrobium electricum]|uniref:histidine kinase n=1 Tax=Rhizomicrobium electricum TaxID=480070 RepID=A0ABN1F7I4_9PROT|nr:HAMP domain-containing sensor histidine kinase [Rhizomicrobium electricum]NIJ46693.1 signal transduction histidine kinase [Rhizomicrobium electricum]